MKVLFFINHDGAIRNFETFLHMLAHRGDEVHLSTMGRRVALMSEATSLEDLCATNPRFSFDITPKERGEVAKLSAALSSSRSYLRYLGPEYADAPKLSERAERYVHPEILRYMTKPGLRSRPGRWMLDRALLRSLERLPTTPVMDAYIEKHKPDVALFTPLIAFRNHIQISALRSAQKAGVPTVLLVHSWDNLTNKGLIPLIPDRVAVWNDLQRQEAVELHSVPKERVAVTGAQSYDHWFGTEPSTTREEFCAKVGLDPAKPFVLYLCSSTFIAPEEVPFVKKWVSLLRQSDRPELREVGVLVRPHPQNTEQWEGVDSADLGGAAVYPRTSDEWAGASSRADYFDSIHHCSAVMGVNTTALIESAIQDRPVLTWLVPEFRDTQEGTLHFHYIGAEDGLLLMADSFPEHERQLAQALAAPDSARSRRFVERFVRPQGIDVPSSPILVEAVSAVAESGPAPKRRHVGRIVTDPFVAAMTGVLFRLARRQDARDQLAAGGDEAPAASGPKKKGDKRARGARPEGPKKRARREEALVRESASVSDPD